MVAVTCISVRVCVTMVLQQLFSIVLDEESCGEDGPSFYTS